MHVIRRYWVLFDKVNILESKEVWILKKRNFQEILQDEGKRVVDLWF